MRIEDLLNVWTGTATGMPESENLNSVGFHFAVVEVIVDSSEMESSKPRDSGIFHGHAIAGVSGT